MTSIARSGPLPCPARRPGFTLLEIMVVMAALGVVMLLATVTLLGAMRIEQAAGSVFRRLTSQADLADQFRQDVARSTSAPDKFEKQLAGPACLILRSVEGNHITYRYEAGVLTRFEIAGASKSQRPLPLGSERVGVEFSRGGSDPRIITLRVFEPPGRASSRHPLLISATLGGDFR